MPKNGEVFKCYTCGKEVYKNKSSQKNRNHLFCSKECAYEGRKNLKRKELERKTNAEDLGEWLKNQYIVKKRSTVSIMKELGVGNHLILDLLKYYNINTRSFSEAVKIDWQNNEKKKELASKNAKENIGKNSDGRIKLKQIMKTEEYKLKISKANRGTNNGMYGKTGELASRYNPVLTSKDREDRRLEDSYRKWREGVFKKDKYTCQCCGYDNGHIIVAHHIYAYRKFKELRYVISNGITLCNNCHKEFHSLYGYGENTKEQMREFIKIKKH